VVSEGPQLFPVPDVSGLTLTAAKKKLADAGFKAAYAAFWDTVADVAKVTSQSPAASTNQVKGTTINLVVSLTG
jgi:eukaryotic-like serine/threonine-protein kinase